MIRYLHLAHRFVRHIPEIVEPGVLYISIDYATAAHSCCCGCGQEVVTPFTPTDWNMTFDGETISLRPSIGNWNLPCRSHYVINKSRIFEAKPWTKAQIEKEKKRDKSAKANFYAQEPATSVPSRAEIEPKPLANSVWSTLSRWLR